MKQKASVIAQRLVNLYRQGHVIIGGWEALNPIFINDATPDVLQEMANIPTGHFLIKHIENLRSGKTPMDSIERGLLPYGGLMDVSPNTVSVSAEQLQEITFALNSFTPDQHGLDVIQNIPTIKNFGNEWIVKIRDLIKNKPELLSKLDLVKQTYRAYSTWNSATNIISQPMSEILRARVQADMPEYETYLPMFGDSGRELLVKLRSALSSMNHTDTGE